MTTPGGPGALPNDTSSIELLEDLGSEFTPAQLANFRTAFEVFDVNKDGKISTDEIFDVLTTMGNEVSGERKRKIHEAVQAVDMEGNGELDFRSFISFMRVMDEVNKLEAQSRADEAARDLENGDSQYERASFRYFFCVTLEIAYARSNMFVKLLTFLILAYNMAFSVGVSVLAIFEWDWMDLNPDGNDRASDINKFHNIITYVRLANLLNFVHIIFLEVHSLFDALQFNGFSRNFSNYVKYTTRPIFVLSMVSSVLLIVGRRDAELSTEFVSDNWEELALPFAQILTTYLTMSYFFYMTTYVEPANGCEKLKVAVCDLFLFNILRIPVAIAKNVVVFLLLPFNIIFFILSCFASCCCKNLFDTRDVQSRSSKFLRLVAYHSG